MMHNRLRWRAGLLLAFLALSLPMAASAQVPLSLEEALVTALEHNTSHALFLWEQELAQEREALKKHPQLSAELSPVSVHGKTLQGPKGELVISVPLGSSLKLSGQVGVALDGKELEAKPTASLSLGYDFFALPPEDAAELTPEETRQRQVNSLVLQLLQLLVDVRKALDERDYQRAVVGHLEAQLAAAQQTPNYDDFELRRKLREAHAALVSAEGKVNQLQLQLQTALGRTETVLYEPQLTVLDFALEPSEEELLGEVRAASAELRRASRGLDRARAELELEQKTAGWKVKATGSLQLSEEAAWSAGLTASKTLYPRRIVLEELELAVAKAEFELQTEENSLLGKLRSSLQLIRSAQNQLSLGREFLTKAEEDLELRRRQHTAGLVTELQVEEAELAVCRAQLDCSHRELDYALSVVDLWSLCGRDLQTAVFQVIR